MNYMDYSDDACRNIFTNQQKGHMRAVFAAGGARVSFAVLKIRELAAEICGTSTTFSVDPNQCNPGTYTWTVTGPLQIVSGQGSSQITCNRNGTGTATITVSQSANGYIDSKSITVGPPLAPRFNASTSLTPACYSSTNSITFSVAAPQPALVKSLVQKLRGHPEIGFCLIIGPFLGGTAHFTGWLCIADLPSIIGPSHVSNRCLHLMEWLFETKGRSLAPPCNFCTKLLTQASTAGPTLFARNVRGRNARALSSGRAPSIKPCRQPGRETLKRIGPFCTISEWGLKARFRKGSEVLACAVRATWAWPKPIRSTSLSPRR